MAQRFLRQIGTQKAPFVWTARRAMRSDMVEYDPSIAKTRINALKQKLSDLQAPPVEAEVDQMMIDETKEIALLESQIQEEQDKKAGIIKPEDVKKEKSDEEIELERKAKIVEEDPEIKKIKELTKTQLGEYSELNYGEKLNQREDRDQLVSQVLEMRIKAIFEVK